MQGAGPLCHVRGPQRKHAVATCAGIGPERQCCRAQRQRALRGQGGVDRSGPRTRSEEYAASQPRRSPCCRMRRIVAGPVDASSDRIRPARSDRHAPPGVRSIRPPSPAPEGRRASTRCRLGAVDREIRADAVAAATASARPKVPCSSVRSAVPPISTIPDRRNRYIGGVRPSLPTATRRAPTVAPSRAAVMKALAPGCSTDLSAGSKVTTGACGGTSTVCEPSG